MYVSWCDADDDDDNEKTLYVLLKCFLMSIQVFYLISSSSLISCRYHQSSNLKLSPWKSRFCLAASADVRCVWNSQKAFECQHFHFHRITLCARLHKGVDMFTTWRWQFRLNFDSSGCQQLSVSRTYHPKKVYLLRKLFHFSHTRWFKIQHKPKQGLADREGENRACRKKWE